MAIAVSQLTEATTTVESASPNASTFRVNDWLVSRRAWLHTSTYALARRLVAMRNDARQIDLRGLCHGVVSLFYFSALEKFPFAGFLSQR